MRCCGRRRRRARPDRVVHAVQIRRNLAAAQRQTASRFGASRVTRASSHRRAGRRASSVNRRQTHEKAYQANVMLLLRARAPTGGAAASIAAASANWRRVVGERPRLASDVAPGRRPTRAAARRDTAASGALAPGAPASASASARTHRRQSDRRPTHEQRHEPAGRRGAHFDAQRCRRRRRCVRASRIATVN